MATVAHTRQGVMDVLDKTALRAAVTLRSNIDTIWNITPIPTVNLEVFFHSGPSVDDVLSSTRQFDVKAFLKRIEALTEIELTDRRLTIA